MINGFEYAARIWSGTLHVTSQMEIGDLDNLDDVGYTY